MSESKWVNYVGEICTWAEFKDGELVSENKSISIKKDFSALFKGTIRLEKYSDYLQKALDADRITKEEYNKKMEFDFSNLSDFEPRKDGKFCFVSHIMHLPPQEERGESPAPFISKSGWTNGVLSIKQDGKMSPYMTTEVDFDFKKDTKIFLANVADDIRKSFKSGQISKSEMEKKLNNIRIKDEDGNPTEDFWMLYKGNIPPKK